MKSLRILTGHHAGAQLCLSNQQQRIGSDEEADIQISDWQHVSVILETDEVSKMTTVLEMQGPSAATAQNTLTTMLDFMPRRFGNVVLCVGPNDATWPNDLAMLERLMLPVAKVQRRFSTGLMVAGGAVTAAFAMISAIASGGVQPPNMTKTSKAESLLVRVKAALQASGAAGLEIRQVEQGVQVEGMVADSSAASRVRASLHEFDNQHVLQRYATATDVIRAISDAAGSVGVHVDYLGAGAFVVKGHTADLGRLRDTMQRVRIDLGTRVTRIDVTATEDSAPVHNRTAAVLAAGGMQYVEAANGTKYFSIVTPLADASLVTPTTLFLIKDRNP
jgi:type III secretion protein D